MVCDESRMKCWGTRTLRWCWTSVLNSELSRLDMFNLRLSDLSTSSPSLNHERERPSFLIGHACSNSVDAESPYERKDKLSSVFPRMGRISSRDKAPSFRHDSKSSRFKFWVRIFTWVYVLDISLWRIVESIMVMDLTLSVKKRKGRYIPGYGDYTCSYYNFKRVSTCSWHAGRIAPNSQERSSHYRSKLTGPIWRD